MAELEQAKSQIIAHASDITKVSPHRDKYSTTFFLVTHFIEKTVCVANQKIA